MTTGFSRRSLLKMAPAAATLPLLGADAWPQTARQGDVPALPVDDLFPTQPPELVREVVLVAHFDLKRIKELVGARPTLAKAAWDWGFGDWESALGAASHMGNRPIAEYLISQGARPSIFSAAMLGQLDVVKSFVTAQPGVQRIRGPHSIPLLAHARAGGAAASAVFEFLQSLGDAGADPPVPLPDGDAAVIAGTYVFGPSASQQVEVTVDKGQLTWTRKGMVGRGLFHLGERTFYPMGAPGAKIRFVADDGGMTMTVYDPGLVLTARKKPPAK